MKLKAVRYFNLNIHEISTCLFFGKLGKHIKLEEGKVKVMLDFGTSEIGLLSRPIANEYVLSNQRSLADLVQLPRGKSILQWLERSISRSWWHIFEAFFYFYSSDRLKGWWRNLKSWRPKQQTSFFENSREVHSCQHTAEHLRGRTKTHWRTHSPLLTVQQHTKHTHTHTSAVCLDTHWGPLNVGHSM